MTRRGLLLLFATRQDFLDVIARLASALATRDAVEFMRWVARDAPGREELQAAIEALTAQAEMTSSVEMVKQDGDTAEVDWYLEIRRLSPGQPVERRRQTVTVRLNSQRRVTSLTPLSFFR